jgi:hypothetical protein
MREISHHWAIPRLCDESAFPWTSHFNRDAIAAVALAHEEVAA